MKTLMLSALTAPACTWRLPGEVEIATPGASAAKFRKLRSFCGRLSICCVDTLVDTIAERTSCPRRPVTTMSVPVPALVPAVSATGAAAPMSKVTT